MKRQCRECRIVINFLILIRYVIISFTVMVRDKAEFITQLGEHTQCVIVIQYRLYSSNQR